VAFDIDYRPNLWGLAGHAEGFERYVKSDKVSAKLKAILPDCNLIVGTEEEIMIATGADDVLGSLKAIRAVSPATIVLKRGAMGCIVYDGAISDDLEDGIVGKGFPIEVFNVLGAGDAFMSGLLRGWLGGEDWDGGDLGQCRRRFRRVAAELLAGISDLDRAAIFSEKRQPASRASQGRSAEPRPLGDHAARRHSASDGARLRPSPAARSDGRQDRGRLQAHP
jgi:sugar/nucleoside kinase (ribokinase family)